MTKIGFLKKVEGNEYTPYVPKSGKSGVTIGIGVDLGNIGIRNLDIPVKLLNKVRPFAGLRGKNAEDAMKRIQLDLSREEVDMLSMAAIEQHEKELEVMYGPLYGELPIEKQIVLLSVKYQYGNLPKRTPKFWKYAKNNDWRSVYYELMNFGDAYPTRRKMEAKLIEKYIEERAEPCLKNYWNVLKRCEEMHKSLVGRVRGPKPRDE